MNIFHQTDTFSDWLENLKDAKTRARILIRVKSAEYGNFSDCAPVGDGISEMRLHFGPGFRLYFWQEDNHVYWLLIGGDKSSQKRDIERAKVVRRRIEEVTHDKNK